MSNAVIFNGDYLKALKPKLKLNEAAYIETGSVDPTTLSLTSPVGSLYLRSDGNLYIKYGPNNTDWAPTLLTGINSILTNTGLDDDSVYFVDNLDNTKKMYFQLSSVGINTSITLTVPNLSGTIALGTGTNGHVTYWNSGALTGEAQLSPSRGGTGVNNTGTLTYGANNVTLTTSGVTSITLPTTGTLATLAGIESLTNKTINSSSIGSITPSSGAFTFLSLKGTGVAGTAYFDLLQETVAPSAPTTSYSRLYATANVVNLKNSLDRVFALDYSALTVSRTLSAPDRSSTIATLDGNQTFTGILSLSTENIVSLAITGGLKVGNVTSSASTAGAGAVRYDSGSNYLSYSNGTSWLSVASLAGVESLTNKTINSSSIGSITPDFGAFTNVSVKGTGVAGTAYLDLLNETFTPSVPSSGYSRLYATTDVLNLKNASNEVFALDYSALTTSRTLSVPDRSSTIATLAGNQTFTDVLSLSAANIVSLAITGGLKVGNVTSSASEAGAGAIKYDSGSLAYSNGTNWNPITSYTNNVYQNVSFTAANNTNYFVDTTTSPITATLPIGSQNARILFSDVKEKWGVNNFTILPATGEKIDNLAVDEPLVMDINGSWIELTWDTTTAGWVINASLTYGETPTGLITQSGNAFNAPMTIGTNDNYDLFLETNGISRVKVSTNGTLGILPTASQAGTLELYELDLYGTNTIALKAPSLLSSSITLTLPNSLPSIAGQVLASDTSGNLTWKSADTELDPTDVVKILPNLDIDFSNKEKILPAISFSRGSAGSYFGSQGFMYFAGIDEYRVEHNPVTLEPKGLLIEEQRTNLLTVTEIFHDSTWAKQNSNIMINCETAPDGSYSAHKLIENSLNGYHTIYQVATVISSTIYTASIFVKKAENDWVFVEISDSVANAYGVYVNLNTGNFGAVETAGSPTSVNKTIENVGNGWYRVSVTANLGLSTSNSLFVQLSDDNGTRVYTGDGKSGTYIWGAQLEAGAFPTSYIPSVESWVSRTGTGGTSNATYFNNDGIIKISAGQRFTNNPFLDSTFLPLKLLLEPERTNLFLQSANLSTSWTLLNATQSSSAQATPDGSTTSKAIILTNDATVGVSRARRQYTTTSGTAFTVSSFVKIPTSGTAFNGTAIISDDTEAGQANFVLSSKSVTYTGICISANIQELPNGWYRISATFLPTTSSSHNIAPYSFSSAGTLESMWCWGAQLEEGYSATSYIATTTTTVKRYADFYLSYASTRASDNISLSGTNFKDWFKFSEGTMYIEADSKGSMDGGVLSNANLFSLTATTSSDQNTLSVIQNPTSSSILSSKLNGQEQFLGNRLASYTINTMEKIAIAMQNNNSGFSYAGSDAVVDSNCFFAAFSCLNIGAGYDNTKFKLNGHIKRLIFWPKRLDNTTIKTITGLV